MGFLLVKNDILINKQVCCNIFFVIHNLTKIYSFYISIYTYIKYVIK